MGTTIVEAVRPVPPTQTLRPNTNEINQHRLKRWIGGTPAEYKYKREARSIPVLELLGSMQLFHTFGRWTMLLVCVSLALAKIILSENPT